MARQHWVILSFMSTWMSLSVLGQICPYQECQCYEDVIECEDLSLKSLPTLVVKSVSWTPYLSLNSNFITKITAGGLPSGLGGIDFEGNPITFIDQNAFSGSENTLTELKFSGVNLDELPFALFFLSNLKHLSITHSQIRQWDESILFFLGNTLDTLILVDAGLTEWQSSLSSMPVLNSLELSSAPFNIPSDAFSVSNVVMVSLTLQNVSLTSIRNMFSNMVALFDLILDNNVISDISGLPNSGNLSVLSLNNNTISNSTHLINNLRPVANSIETIYMNYNKLTNFPDMSFMTKLQTLALSHNLISNTELGSVPSSLLFLELEDNKITSLTSFLQKGQKLNTLRFAYNYIKIIRGVDIPPSVTDMDISFNIISELTDTSFPPNSKMITLRLDINPISAIAQNAFSNLPNLTYLSMTNSRLTRLPVAVITLQNLRTLNMNGNFYLVCTCMDISLRAWSMSIPVIISGDCGLASIDYFLKTLSTDCPH